MRFLLALDLVARNKRHDMRHAVHVHHGDIALRVEGKPAPVRPAPVEGIEDRALKRRRREKPLAAIMLQTAVAGKLVEGEHTPAPAFLELLRNERRRLHRKRLRRRQLLAGHVGLRHLALFHTENGLARIAVEHEEKAGLGRLNDHIFRLAVMHDGGKRRLRGKVVIPDIVMHGLERPDHLPGFYIHGDD